MSQSKTNELEEYVVRLGKYIKDERERVDAKIDELYTVLMEVKDEIASLKDTISREQLMEVKDEIASLKDTISREQLMEVKDEIASLKENTTPKIEFDEFVSRLTEILKGLLPSAPTVVEGPIVEEPIVEKPVVDEPQKEGP
jgi:gas vesicle protein